ncbi:MAG: hypothetical protein LC130_24425, partial [Bryobacterales bacterium]|nr:hypothetical protein [Bryobacterales bacterium]
MAVGGNFKARLSESQPVVDTTKSDAQASRVSVAVPLSSRAPMMLPEPVFPLHPEKCGDVPPDLKSVPSNGSPYRTRVTPFMIRRALRGWLY